MSEERKALVSRVEVPIRFSEVDSLRVVWHGNYLIYFEAGREAFGKEFDLEYLDVFDKGFVTPIVRSEIEHKLPLYYGDTAVVETEFVDHAAAKIVFRYRVFSKKTGKLAATGQSTQVFTDHDGELWITLPDFFSAWKKQHGL